MMGVLVLWKGHIRIKLHNTPIQSLYGAKNNAAGREKHILSVLGYAAPAGTF